MSKKALFATVAATVAVAAAVFQFSPLIAQDASGSDVYTRTAVVDAAWANTVTITVNDDDTFRFQSNGMPDHGFADQYLIPTDPTDQPFSDKPAAFFNVVNSADFFTETQVDTTITTLPIYTNDVTDTSLGRIGVALSGAQLFNDYEDMARAVVALDDQVIHDHVAFLDDCNGHTLVDGSDYHYHGIPVCLTVRLDVEGEHSYMLGLLEDGFPVYANQDVNGEVIGSEALDECSGHVGATPEFPQGTYHYHLTADEAPYMIDCYHGEIEQASKMGNAGGGPDLTAAAAALGIDLETLRGALGNGRPDFDAAADILGISVDTLVAVMPAPPQ